MYPCSNPQICGVQNHRDGTVCSSNNSQSYHSDAVSSTSVVPTSATSDLDIQEQEGMQYLLENLQDQEFLNPGEGKVVPCIPGMSTDPDSCYVIQIDIQDDDQDDDSQFGYMRVKKGDRVYMDSNENFVYQRLVVQGEHTPEMERLALKADQSNRELHMLCREVNDALDNTTMGNGQTGRLREGIRASLSEHRNRTTEDGTYPHEMDQGYVKRGSSPLSKELCKRFQSTMLKHRHNMDQLMLELRDEAKLGEPERSIRDANDSSWSLQDDLGDRLNILVDAVKRDKEEGRY